METLDVTDGFDLHEHRASFKLLRQGGDTVLLENRDGLGCPACGEEFDRLLVVERETLTLSSAPGGPLCLLRTPDQLVVVGH